MTNNSTQHVYEKKLDVSFILPTYVRQVGPSSEKKCKIQSRGNVIKSRTIDAQITVFIDLQDQLNMFWTNICPSSGA
jgi:hypothetical protein